jgi:Ca2+/H+ antiporter, TMEM165/GDT1 family
MTIMRLTSQKSLDLIRVLILLNLCLLIKADLQPMEIENDDVVLKAEIKEEKLGSTTTTAAPTTSNLGFIHGFIASFSVIIVSEIGDKTFFIACIMAMVSVVN